ncbi:MAG TPA: hypothetical protein VEQ41_06805 [Solirubrobacterales bacterium]|nr:hypothetical protein [Solirubrobacterales bacterium]
MEGSIMSSKLKVLGSGLLAVLATSAFAALNASATTPANSHFVANPPTHTLNIVGTEQFQPGDPSKTHHVSIYRQNADTTTVSGSEPLKCTHVHYHGRLTGSAATTTQAIQVRPQYTGCSTGGFGPHNMAIHVPESCGTNVYEFTSGAPGTIHINCPITITHPNCTMRIPVQTVSGDSYTNVVEGGVEKITAHTKIDHITWHFEAGICVFLGTSHRFEMVGSVTFEGRDAAGNPVNIRHT